MGNDRSDYEEKIKKLEKRIELLEQEKENEKDDDQKTDSVESVVEQFIPGLSGIVKALEKTSPEFRKRIAETDSEIKHRLETGWSSTPEMKHGISMRPIISEGRSVQGTSAGKQPEKEQISRTIERPLIVDVFEEKDYISVIAEIPGLDEKEINIKLNDNILEISAGDNNKIITLPSSSENIIEKQFKNGILQLKIRRKIDVG